MKRALIGVFAIAAVAALRPLSKRIGRKMSQHCAQMATKCKETMSAHAASGKATDTHERFDREHPQSLGDRDPVGTT